VARLRSALPRNGSRGFTEFDSNHPTRFRVGARFNKTGAFNRSANLPHSLNITGFDEVQHANVPHNSLTIASPESCNLM
jgi:hypothetical protein